MIWMKRATGCGTRSHLAVKHRHLLCGSSIVDLDGEGIKDKACKKCLAYLCRSFAEYVVWWLENKYPELGWDPRFDEELNTFLRYLNLVLQEGGWSVYRIEPECREDLFKWTAAKWPWPGAFDPEQIVPKG